MTRVEKQIDRSPIENFAIKFTEACPKEADVWRILTPLTVVPSLQFLRHGLVLSGAALEQCADDLDLCLKLVPGNRLSSAELRSAIQTLLQFIDGQGWDPEDSRLTLMGRTQSVTDADIQTAVQGGGQHPLHGYSVSKALHWSNLFYTAELEKDRDDYDRLMREFSGYVIAAFSQVSTQQYVRYCRQWWIEDRQPDDFPLPVPCLFGRAASASLVTRRLSLSTNRDVFEALRPSTNPLPFHGRIAEAIRDRRRWNDQQFRMLSSVAILIHTLRPGWFADTRATRRRNVGKGTKHSTLPGGFVRITGTDFAMRKVDGDLGETYEMLFSTGDDSDPTSESGDGESNGDGESESKGGQADPDEHSQWMPPDDLMIGDPLVAMRIDPEAPEFSRLATRPFQARWAETHLRRANFAHRLPNTWVSREEAQAILRKARLVKASDEMAVSMALIVGALLTSRTIDFVRKILLLRRSPTAQESIDHPLIYRLDLGCWEVFVPPPAWDDQPLTRCERPISHTLLLPDPIGFGKLLAQWGLDQTCTLGIGKVSGKRRSTLLAWLREATNDRHISIAAIEQALHARVLTAARGDTAAVRLITDRVHSHGGSAAHYSWYPIEPIQQKYLESLSALGLTDSLATIPDALKALSVDSSIGVGARRVPTIAAVKGLFATLRDRHRTAMRARCTAEAQNLFCTYVLAAMTLALAMRAVTDPHLADIAPHSAFATFSDKARTDYHRRVTFVASSILPQLREYTRYVQLDAAHLRISHDGKQQIAFAYIDPVSLRHEPYRPKHFERIVGEFFDLELYSLRRFARTHLIGTTASVEDIDALLGHWFEGVSPHDQLSVYPMSRLRALSEEYIDGMMKLVGFATLHHRAR